MMRARFYVARNMLQCKFTEIENNKNKTTVSTKIKVHPEQFHSKLQFCEIPAAQELIKLWNELAKTNYIDTIRIAIKNSNNKGQRLTLIEVGHIYLKQKELASSTIKKREFMLRKLGDILPHIKSTPIQMITKRDIQDIYNAFRLDNNLNSSKKKMGTISGYFNYAIEVLEILDKNPTRGFSFKSEVKDIVYLNEDELSRLKKLKLTGTIKMIRDVFLFACNTGFEYNRVFQFQKSQIKQNQVDGKKWAFTSRKKTDKNANVPLNKIALAIIDEYKDSDTVKVFPVKTNQTHNEYLKVIQSFAKIEKKLTTHLARHTFATTICLLNGVPPTSTAKYMGITVKRLLRTYGEIVDEKLSQDFWAAQDLIDKKDKKKKKKKKDKKKKKLS